MPTVVRSRNLFGRKSVIAVAYNGDDPAVVYRDLHESNPEALVCKGFEEAYIGHTVGEFPVAVYDYGICVDIVAAEGEITDHEAKICLYYKTIMPSFDLPFAPLFVKATMP